VATPACTNHFSERRHFGMQARMVLVLAMPGERFPFCNFGFGQSILLAKWWQIVFEYYM